MEYINLNELCEINIGKTPSRNIEKYWGQGHNWLAISDLKNKLITNTKEMITDEAINDCNMKIVKKGTVVMSFKLSIGKIGILQKDMFTNEAIANFPIKDKSQLIPEYLYYALKTLRFNDIDRAVMGATLNKAKLNKLKIPFFDIEKQQKIVGILNESQILIEKRKEQIELLDELVKSRFIEIFGDPFYNPNKWDIKTFGEVFEISSSSRILKSEWKSEGIPFYRVRDMVKLSESGSVDNEFFVSEQFYSSLSSSKGIPEAGDIMVSATSTIGKCYVVKENEKFYYKDADVLRFRKKIELLPEYFIHFMKTQFAINQIKSTFGITTVPHFTIVNAKKINMAYPPINLQKEFSDFVKQVDKLKFEMEKSLKELKDNFDSLMQKAFKGELFND